MHLRSLPKSLVAAELCWRMQMSLMDNRQGVLANAQRKADMSMMCMLKGRERSRAQWEALFAACGFKPLHVKGTRTPFYIITAEPV